MQGFFVTMKVAVYAAFYFCAQKPLFYWDFEQKTNKIKYK